MWTSFFLSKRQLCVWVDKHICPAHVSQRANKKHCMLSAHAKERSSQEVHAVNASIWAYGTLSSAGDLPWHNALFAPLMFWFQYMFYYVAKSKIQSLCNKCNVNLVHFDLLATFLMHNQALRILLTFWRTL